MEKQKRLGKVIFFSVKAKNAHIALTTSSIYNVGGGKKNLPKVITYFFTVQYEKYQMKLFKVFIPVMLLLFFSCKESPKIDFDAIANDLCKCMQPLADINDEIVAATEKNDSVAMQRLILEIESVAAKSEQCAQKLDIKYGVVPTKEEPKAEVAFKKACPEIAKIMEQ